MLRDSLVMIRRDMRGARDLPQDSEVVQPVICHAGSIKPNKSFPDEKPLASGTGINIGITLAEPVLFLQGLDSYGSNERNTAMLRGTLVLNVLKTAKIKAITLQFKGKATTIWPEGIPPKRMEFEETDTFMNHTWTFFNAQFPPSQMGPDTEVVSVTPRLPSSVSLTTPRDRWSHDMLGRHSSIGRANSRALKRYSLPARSHGHDVDLPVVQKGYRTFSPGEYIYNFQLPLDSHLPETLNVGLGSVRYELEATVERAGAFRANLVGNKEIVLIRVPAEGSLEQVEPISISRNWEDQLLYDIIIYGKSFPLGSKVPIAFKFTPLSKVQCHRIKVFVTENVEYFCHSKSVHRMEPTNKLLLFERRADGSSSSTFPGSSVRIVSGGGIPHDKRAAAARGECVVPEDPSNLFGNLESPTGVGPTELELNVQLPCCPNVGGKDKTRNVHFDTTYSNIRVRHTIKILIRLSRLDRQNPSKRRHFEISIDSPLNILSCHASQSNTALPAYDALDPSPAEVVPLESQSLRPTGFLSPPAPSSIDISDGAGLESREQRLSSVGSTEQSWRLPIHLLQVPSFNPPAFEDEASPSGTDSPPPAYETISRPTSRLADYFSRLSTSNSIGGLEGIHDPVGISQSHGRGLGNRMPSPLHATASASQGGEGGGIGRRKKTWLRV